MAATTGRAYALFFAAVGRTLAADGVGGFAGDELMLIALVTPVESLVGDCVPGAHALTTSRPTMPITARDKTCLPWLTAAACCHISEPPEDSAPRELVRPRSR